MYTISSILVPTDFSECSKHALEYSKELVKPNNAILYLLHIIEPVAYPVNWGYAQVGFVDVEKEYEKAAQEEMKRLSDQLTGEGYIVETLIINGARASDEIVSIAQEKRVSLICISTHGRGGLDHMLFGSTTERVLRKAPCPVFVVKAPKK